MKQRTVFILLSFSVMLLLHCGKSTETTVVTGNSDLLPSESDTTTTVTPSQNRSFNDDFSRIRIGETSLVETLDPLFAKSNSELRTIHLIYDGLFRLDENGDAAPALAKRWEMTRDSLRYRFYLNRDIYYHNSNTFSNGLGRRINASDVEHIFMRMGKVQVPDYAAHMFSNIQGFDAYHTEQTYVKNPAQRVISKIQGITIENDSTLIIQLNEKDPDFLKKLAHPWASVYARESVDGNGPIEKPIGTGPYYFVRKQDQEIILASNNVYPFEENLPDRLDIKSGLREADIYQSFARNELDVLNEIGPSTIRTLVGTNQELSVSYAEIFSIYRPEVYSTFPLFYNPRSNQSRLLDVIFNTNPDSLIRDSRLGDIYFKEVQLPSEPDTLNRIQVAHTNNPFEVFLLNSLAEWVTGQDISLSLNGSYAVTNEVALSTTDFPDAIAVLDWHTPVYCVFKKGSGGISITHTPWNVSYSGFEVASGGN